MSLLNYVSVIVIAEVLNKAVVGFTNHVVFGGS